MRKCAVCLLVLFFAACCYGQTVPLEIRGGDVKVVKIDKVVIVKEDLTVVSTFPFTIQAPPGDGFYFWQLPPGVVGVDKGSSIEITSAPKGTLVIGVKMLGADWEAKKFVTKFGSVQFAVGEPGPKPPDPKPPDPPPIPAPTGFRVIIVYETSAKMTKEQLNIINSTRIAAFLNDKCVKGSDGRPEWRKWDKDVVVSEKETKTIQELWTATKPQVNIIPAIVIVTDGKGAVHPFPDTEQATMDLLTKAAGAGQKKGGL